MSQNRPAETGRAPSLLSFERHASLSIPYTPECHGVFALQLYAAGECRAIRKQVEGLEGWEQAQVAEISPDGQYRLAANVATRSARVLAPQHAPTVCDEFDEKVNLIVKPFIQQVWGVELSRHSGTHLVRYEPGGFYRAHTDASGPLADRYFSLVCYLNDDFEGGGTSFPSLGYTTRPEAGKAILFPARFVHQAEPVRTGEKLIFVTLIYGPFPITWM